MTGTRDIRIRKVETIFQSLARAGVVMKGFRGGVATSSFGRGAVCKPGGCATSCNGQMLLPGINDSWGWRAVSRGND